MRISDFEWDDGNVLHLALGHGIEPEEAEEVFVVAPLIRQWLAEAIRKELRIGAR